RNTMKRTLAGALTIGLLLSTAGTSMSLAQTEAQKALAGVEIRYLQPAMPQFAALAKFIPEFEEKYGIKVTIDEIPFDQYRRKSLVEMRHGTGSYDIYAVAGVWSAEYGDASFLAPQLPYVKNPELAEENYAIDDCIPRVLSGAGVYNDILYG